MILKPGSSGPDVERLQLQLKVAGYDVGAVDGNYGPKTAVAVLAFQSNHPDLADDGVAGPMTLAALDALDHPADPSVVPAEVTPCNAETWAAFLAFIDAIVGKPVRYGPGRGLWVENKFEIGYSPGRASEISHLKIWPNVLGVLYPALHCTSFTNLFLSWLLRRNEDFTHGGNGPDLMELLAADASLHVVPDKWTYRGFKDSVFAITPDGSGTARSGFSRWPVVDAMELLARARSGSLPTFVLFSQSSKQHDGSWNTDHHTGLYVAREGKLYRIAADGMVNAAKQYTAQPMHWVEITDQNVGAYAGAVYRVWGVATIDGSYGDPSRPIAEIDFEGA